MDYLTVIVRKNGDIYETILDDIFIPRQTLVIHTSVYDLITYLLDIKALFRFIDSSKLTLRIKYRRKYYTYEEFKERYDEPRRPSLIWHTN